MTTRRAMPMILAVVGMVGAGCGRKSNEEILKEQEERVAEMKAKDAERTARISDAARKGPGFAILPRVAAPPATPGPAYLYVDKVGIAVLDQGKFHMVSTEVDPFVWSLTTTAKGTLLVGATAVYRLDGDTLVPVGDPKAFKTGDFGNRGFLKWLAARDDGRVWTASDEWFGYWDGKSWTFQSAAELGLGTVPLEGKPYQVRIGEMLVDDDDRVFVRSDHGVYVQDGTTWKAVYDALSAGEPAIYTTHIYPHGKELLVTTHQGMLHLDGTALKLEAYDAESDRPKDHSFVFGDELVGVDSHEAVWAQLAGDTARGITFKDKKIDPGVPNTAAIDGQGRVWMGAENGVVIVDHSLAVTHWLPGSIPEISAQVRVIHLVGGGPALPRVGEVARGTIRGHLVQDGKPVLAATVEICASPSWTFTRDRTPCSDAPFHQSAQSQSDGSFVIADVPLNNYGLAVHHGSMWYTTMGATCAGMSAGDTCDVGELGLQSN